MQSGEGRGGGMTGATGNLIMKAGWMTWGNLRLKADGMTRGHGNLRLMDEWVLWGHGEPNTECRWNDVGPRGT